MPSGSSPHVLGNKPETRFHRLRKDRKEWSDDAMERAEAIDLDTLGVTASALPQNGERLIHDTKAKGLALRLRASGARTWVILERSGSKTARRTLGSAKLLPLDTARRMVVTRPVDAAELGNPPAPAPCSVPMRASQNSCRASSLPVKRDAGRPARSETCGRQRTGIFSPCWGDGKLATSPRKTLQSGISMWLQRAARYGWPCPRCPA